MQQPPKQHNSSWVFSLLSEKFFTSCLLHDSSSKKSEKNIFCLDCCNTICHRCLSGHHSHRLLQVRRYVYHDVVRLDDVERLFDCGFVQSYTTNSAKVIFLNQRPQSRPFKGSGSVCNICERNLQQPYHFCSLSCKVQYLLQKERCISRYLYDGEYSPLPDLADPNIEGLKELEDEDQRTPISVLDDRISLRTSSGSSANGDNWHVAVGCTATTENVTRKKRTRKVTAESGISSFIMASQNAGRRRKSVPIRSPLY